MEKLVNNFNIKENFWDCNPNLKYVSEFKKLYSSDDSKKNVNSSRIMWAIALLLDRHEDNPYRNLSETDKKTIISEDFLEDKKFDFDKYKYLISAYENLCMNAIERTLLLIERKLEERDLFLSTLSYNISTASDIDGLIINTKKLKDLYMEMKNELSKIDSIDGVTRGGRKESAGEKGLI